jgi:hypothetical protein
VDQQIFTENGLSRLASSAYGIANWYEWRGAWPCTLRVAELRYDTKDSAGNETFKILHVSNIMASLKALKSIFLKFAVDSPCAGLYLIKRLSSPRLVKTNPECQIDFEVSALWY